MRQEWIETSNVSGDEFVLVLVGTKLLVIRRNIQLAGISSTECSCILLIRMNIFRSLGRLQQSNALLLLPLSIVGVVLMVVMSCILLFSTVSAVPLPFASPLLNLRSPKCCCDCSLAHDLF